MKSLKYVLFFSLFSGWMIAAGQNSASAPLQKKPAAEVKKMKKTEKNVDTVLIQTDKQGRTYQIVDGRKVFVDSQGNQSLAVPADTVKKVQVIK